MQGLAARLGASVSREAPIVVQLKQGSADRPPLFCIFGVHLYQDLALALDDRSVWALHVPFWYVPGKEPPPTLEEIGRRYVELIRARQEHGPYHLLGLCLGGIVAYQAARQLEAEGEIVEAVTVIDAILPSAEHVQPGNRLREYADSIQKAWHEPERFTRWLRKHQHNLFERIPLLKQLKEAAGRSGLVSAIELPIVGPEVSAEIAR